METILIFDKYTEWLKHLENLNDTTWFKPVKEGKWSVHQIIAHILHWDEYLIEHVFKLTSIDFPDHDLYNKQAIDLYAHFNKEQLIQQSTLIRKKLVNLLELNEEEMNLPMTVNGSTHCPHTNSLYTRDYLINEFIWHDHHHIIQIDEAIISSPA